MALPAPTMGLGLWLALLCGGLSAVAIDTALALRALRGPDARVEGTQASDKDTQDPMTRISTTPSTPLASGGTT